MLSIHFHHGTEKDKQLTQQPRDYPSDFDFIHTRVTIGCWSDMKRQIIQRAFDHLQPGGWLECQEVPSTLDCDDDTLTESHGFQRWAKELDAAAHVADRQTNVAPELKDWMREVGFVDVQEMVFKIPVNGWPKEVRLKHVGMMWQRNLLEGLSGFSLGFFNRFRGKSVEEIEVSEGHYQSLADVTVIMVVFLLTCGGMDSSRWWMCARACLTAPSTRIIDCTSSGDGSPEACSNLSLSSCRQGRNPRAQRGTSDWSAWMFWTRTRLFWGGYFFDVRIVG